MIIIMEITMMKLIIAIIIEKIIIKIHVSVDQKTILNLTSVFPFPADQSRSMDDSERIEEGTAVAMTGTSMAGEGVDRTVLVHRIAGIFCTNSFMLGK